MSDMGKAPRSMPEMLIEMTDQRNELALALRDMLAAQTPEAAALARQRAQAVLAKVPQNVLSRRPG